MTTVNLLNQQDSTIRTQITLTESLKQLVDLGKLADQLIGSVNIKKNPQWKTVGSVKKWVKKLRTEWI